MKIYKGQYGWSTSAHSKTKDGKSIKCYVDVQFAHQSEPLLEEVEGKLIFRQEDGTERECFLSSYEKKGIPIPKIVMMPKGYRGKEVQTVLTDGKRDLLGHTTVDTMIDPDELPFY